MKFTSSLKLKLIYVFRINDAAHRGCLKAWARPLAIMIMFSVLSEQQGQRVREETHQPIYADGWYRIRPLIYGTDDIQQQKGLALFLTTRKCIAFWNVPALGKDIRYREQSQRVVHHRP